MAFSRQIADQGPAALAAVAGPTVHVSDRSPELAVVLGLCYCVSTCVWCVWLWASACVGAELPVVWSAVNAAHRKWLEGSNVAPWDD